MTGLRPGPAWTLSVPGASQDLWTAGKGAGLALASALGPQTLTGRSPGQELRSYGPSVS